MGAAATRALVSEGKEVVMACRDLVRGEKLLKSILSEYPGASVRLHKLDLSSFAGVREFVSSLEGMKVSGLFNNAAVLAHSYSKSPDGYEMDLQTNYLSPGLLCLLLLPLMEKDGNIVNMVSLTCRFGKIDERLFERGAERFTSLGTYSDSKLAFMLFSVALCKRLENSDIKVNVSDPGVVNSKMLHMEKWYDALADIVFVPFTSSPEKGVRPALRALHSSHKGHLFKGRKDAPIAGRYITHPLVDWCMAQVEGNL